MSNKLEPFVSWLGGKRRLLNKIQSLLPPEFNTYYEPFVGGGAVLFSIKPSKAIVNDINKELIYAYNYIDKCENLDTLFNLLDEHTELHGKDYYYSVRSTPKCENEVINTARFLYLNKACFNGIYRVNKKGIFNTPFGHKEKLTDFNKPNLTAIKNYFNSNDITFTSADFTEVVKEAKAGDFVYFDPPYDAFDNTETFVLYSKGRFDKEDQIRLADLVKDLTKRGVYVMLSNHNTTLIKDLYKDFNIYVTKVNRTLNSDPNGRGAVEEVLITNY